MAVALLASQCPAPVAIAANYVLGDGSDDPPVLAPHAMSLVDGDTDALRPKLNYNALRIDLAAMYGGAYGIMYGLTASVSSGLNLSISAGQFSYQGVLQLDAATLMTLPDNQARVYVWVKSNNALDYSLTTSPPTNGVGFLCSCPTSGGAIGTLDTSGVFSIYNGISERQTADADAPLDSPSAAMRFFTKTLGGTFYWDGANHRPFPGSEIFSGARHYDHVTFGGF